MSEVEMGQVPVKWVYETFDEKPPAIPVNGSYVVSAPLDHDILPHAVVPLEALREVVEGLKVIGMDTYCDGPGCGWCENGNRHPFTENAKAAQRLLARLGEEDGTALRSM